MLKEKIYSPEHRLKLEKILKEKNIAERQI